MKKVFEYKKFEVASKLIRVEVPEWIIHWDDRIKYLIVRDYGKVIDDNIIDVMVGDKFTSHINELVSSYLFKKVEPPAEIASVVMNMADDYLSGRDIVIRAGDYITIQNYIRKTGFA